MFFVFLIVALMPLPCDSLWPKNLTVGVINTANGERLFVKEAAFREAEKKLKLNGYLPNDLIIRFVFASPCDDFQSLKAVGNFHEKEKVDVIFGPHCGPGITAAGLLASYHNLPIASNSVLDTLNDKTKYSTLYRVAFSAAPLGDAIVSLLINYNWTHVAIVRTHGQECITGLSGVYNSIKKRNIFLTELYADTVLDMRIALNMVKSVARIIILCFGWDPSSAQTFLTEAKAKNMLNNEYVYIVPVYGQALFNSWKPWDANISVESKLALLQIYQNTIVVEPASQLVGKLFLSQIENLTNVTLDSLEILLLPLLHDSFYLYGLAANKTVEVGQNIKNGSSILESIKNQTFSGITGLIMTDLNGDRIPQYYITARSPDGQDLKPYSVATFDSLKDNFKFDELRTAYWGTADNSLPFDIPLCGFLNEFCQPNSRILPIGLPIGLISLTIIVSIAVYYRRKKLNKQLECMVWKIVPSELKFTSDRRTFSSMVSFSTQLSTNDHRQTKIARNISCKLENEFDEKIAHYKGRTVIVKYWNKNEPINLSRNLLIHLKQMKEFEHRNLSVFIGAHLESTSPKMILWAHCSKGSLSEILFQEEIKLDPMFKSSFLRDIIEGLNYLHKSPIGHHGSLNIDNCLVNSHWVIRLSNFGTDKIWPHKLTMANIFQNANFSTQDLYHMDPSYLKTIKNDSIFVFNKSSDIYSLAIIVYQLLFSMEPYSETLETNEEILNRIMEQNLRPDTSKVDENSNPKLIELMKLCWHDNPTNRPTIVEVKNVVRSSTRKYGKNLIDNVLSMLEKYADNLEKLVEERTEQLLEERTKTENLLHQLLPRSVADILKRGDAVIPESYESVTIYFSDIVGFTEFCSQSSPIQIVGFLNHLYSGIDGLLPKFDVYKVETIGDAYMVVSGLPDRNGAKHATEIVRLSFEILKFLTTFKIPHMPHTFVQIRIGIHTGPVAAGVVGLKMPRFCLFGDTVNMASRMESTGLANKIQISECTKNFLDNVSSYDIQCRGQMEVKGKGICTTFWLQPKEQENSFANPLREL